MRSEVDLTGIKRVFLLGVGGIGMSALARYFLSRCELVAGYDRASTELTAALEAEGIQITHQDSPSGIPEPFRVFSQETLIIYSPALSPDFPLILYFQNLGFTLHKRASVLGAISLSYHTYAIAGSHGKTTTSTMLAYVLSETVGCDAFLGGISRNLGSNWIASNRDKKLLVVEADEYDRSFHQLSPDIALITSIAPDHLDYYGSFANLVESFRHFATLSKSHRLLCHASAKEHLLGLGLDLITYGVEIPADYVATNLGYRNANATYTAHLPDGRTLEVKLGVPGRHNVENSLAVIALALHAGVEVGSLLPLLRSFKGVERRFSVRFQDEKVVYIDDYAHHPDEIRATIEAARSIFPGRHITGIFQPHLYSRTRDFAYEFAHALSNLDCALLLPIYPAREKPIEGVSSEQLLSLLPPSQTHSLVTPDSLLQMLGILPLDVLLTMGAGSIGQLAGKIETFLRARGENEG